MLVSSGNDECLEGLHTSVIECSWKCLDGLSL